MFTFITGQNFQRCRNEENRHKTGPCWDHVLIILNKTNKSSEMYSCMLIQRWQANRNNAQGRQGKWTCKRRDEWVTWLRSHHPERCPDSIQASWTSSWKKQRFKARTSTQHTTLQPLTPPGQCAHTQTRPAPLQEEEEDLCALTHHTCPRKEQQRLQDQTASKQEVQGTEATWLARPVGRGAAGGRWNIATCPARRSYNGNNSSRIGPWGRHTPPHPGLLMRAGVAAVRAARSTSASGGVNNGGEGRTPTKHKADTAPPPPPCRYFLIRLSFLILVDWDLPQ